jgi:hypothetical protein
MTENSKTNEAVKEFKPVKKLSPFVADQFNTRGGKGGKKGSLAAASGNAGKKLNFTSSIKKGGSGDR